jgi:D-alanyl-D-alanine carboxypeptidase (penicillin-binding protein 5/6)
VTQPRTWLGALLVLAIAPMAMLAPSAAADAPAASAIHSGRSVDDPLSHTHDVVVDGHAPPKVYAKSWIVVDVGTGDVLAAKNAHQRLRPASTLKTLTAITLLPRLDLDSQYRASWQDAHVVGSAVGIVPGSRYTVDDLFYGLMLPSGNDAARALASANGGRPATVRQMNATARALGAMDTHAVNPSGLDAPGQHTSSFDLALFAREGLQDKDFRRYVSTTSVAFPAQEPKHGKKRDSFMIYNQNPLLIDGYRGILGVKTGYTTQAGRTYVAAAERGGQQLIVALMGVVESSETAATKLFDWGWAHVGTITPVGSLDAPHRPLIGLEAPADGAVGAEASPSPFAADANPTPAGDSTPAGVAPSLLGWVAAGAALIAAGVWLQARRRPTGLAPTLPPAAPDRPE